MVLDCSKNFYGTLKKKFQSKITLFRKFPCQNWLTVRLEFSLFFHKKFTFPSISLDVRVLWPWFFLELKALVCAHVVNTQFIGIGLLKNFLRHFKKKKFQSKLTLFRKFPCQNWLTVRPWFFGWNVTSRSCKKFLCIQKTRFKVFRTFTRDRRLRSKKNYGPATHQSDYFER